MKIPGLNSTLVGISLAAAVSYGITASEAQRPGARPKTSLVNTFIGTSNSGNTFPGASAPFGMVQFSPDSALNEVSYQYNLSRVDGFSLIHMSGGGCENGGNVLLTATTGPVVTDVADYSSPIDHAKESAAPGFYQVSLLRWGIHAEVTATERAGVAKFSFPAGKDQQVLLPLSHVHTELHSADLKFVGDHEIEGQITSGAFCGCNKPIRVYFVVRTDQPVSKFGTWTGKDLSNTKTATTQAKGGPAIGAYLTFAGDKARDVEVKVGISYVDVKGARQNLEKEIGRQSFDQVHRAATQKWEQSFRRFDVSGGTELQQKLFYSALYHCLLMPNLFSDVDGRYIGFDDKTRTVDPRHPVYANFSGWDIYRNEATLLAIIEPSRLEDMVQSIALMREQSGSIDRWPQANRSTAIMNGDPLSAVVATAYAAGLRHFDVNSAYIGMTQANESTRDFDKFGYRPNQVADTLEYAYAYSAVSRVAKALGKTEDAALFAKRSEGWRNMFDQETGFLRPKDDHGQWRTPFDPVKGDGYVEGSAWHYRWLVPHDVAGLIKAMGGDDTFNRELDSFFNHPPLEWNSRYYNAYNEPDLQAPFLYNWSGQPWKAQSNVHELLEKVYKDGPDGIPGNDDCGTMSAWYVLSAIGLYPVDPSRPVLELCAPIFNHVTIRLTSPHAGTARIEVNRTDGGEFVQGVEVDGKPTLNNWIPLEALTHGKVVKFTLGKTPSPTWGVAPANRPPSGL